MQGMQPGQQPMQGNGNMQGMQPSQQPMQGNGNMQGMQPGQQPMQGDWNMQGMQPGQQPMQGNWNMQGQQPIPPQHMALPYPNAPIRSCCGPAIPFPEVSQFAQPDYRNPYGVEPARNDFYEPSPAQDLPGDEQEDK
jgi:morphogenetic protein associated with SpoVID